VSFRGPAAAELSFGPTPGMTRSISIAWRPHRFVLRATTLSGSWPPITTAGLVARGRPHGSASGGTHRLKLVTPCMPELTSKSGIVRAVAVQASKKVPPEKQLQYHIDLHIE